MPLNFLYHVLRQAGTPHLGMQAIGLLQSDLATHTPNVSSMTDMGSLGLA